MHIMKQSFLLIFSIFTLMSCNSNNTTTEKPTTKVKVVKAELVVDAKALLGEGAVWSTFDSVLYWVDIEGKKIHCYQPQNNKDTIFELDERIGCLAISAKNEVMAALETGIYRINTAKFSKTIVVPYTNEPKTNRSNDGKCDANGRFWVGTLDSDLAPNKGNLYCLQNDKTLVLKEKGVTIPNGIVWTSDNKIMYFVDSHEKKIFAYDYDIATGNCSNKRIAIDIPEEMGTPDGMTIDSENMLWVAHWGGYCVRRWNPTNGEVLLQVDVAAQNVTSCSFAPDLRTLYITTAKIGTSDEMLAKYPQSGGLFVYKTDVDGTVAYTAVIQ